jgi:hypothetical protein
MTPSRSCRYGHLVELLAAIDGDPVPELPACEEPAAWATYVRWKRDGQDVDAYTRTCNEHDRGFHGTPGYVRSTALAPPRKTHA